MEKSKVPSVMTAEDLAAGLWLLGTCLLTAGRPKPEPVSSAEPAATAKAFGE